MDDAEELINSIIRLLVVGDPLDVAALRSLVYDYWSRRTSRDEGNDPDDRLDDEPAFWERIGRAPGDWGY